MPRIALVVLLCAGLLSGEDQRPVPRFPRILCVTAEWCGPCQAMKAESFEWLKHGKVPWRIDDTIRANLQLIDADKYPEILKDLNVESVPTLILVSWDGEIARSGYYGKSTFADLLKKLEKPKPAPNPKTISAYVGTK